MTHLEKKHFSAAFLFKGNGAQAQTNKPIDYRILRADMFTTVVYLKPGIPGECMHPLIIICWSVHLVVRYLRMVGV